jgi:hypothetical protein
MRKSTNEDFLKKKISDTNCRLKFRIQKGVDFWNKGTNSCFYCVSTSPFIILLSPLSRLKTPSVLFEFIFIYVRTVNKFEFIK